LMHHALLPPGKTVNSLAGRNTESGAIRVRTAESKASRRAIGDRVFYFGISARRCDRPIDVAEGADESALLNGKAVHLPLDHIPRRDVAPHDVGFSVAIEIADAFGMPIDVGDRGHVAARAHSASVHQPSDHVAGRLVPLYDIGLAVLVQITDSDDLPIQIGDCRGIDRRGGRYAVHQPDHVLTGRSAAP